MDAPHDNADLSAGNNNYRPFCLQCREDRRTYLGPCMPEQDAIRMLEQHRLEKHHTLLDLESCW